MLVHGGGAHTGWWEPVIPHLAPGRRIVSLDLSGHGDSGRRDAYPMSTWADEVAAVIEAAIGGPAVVVGHSMGGRVAPMTAYRHPELVEALVIVDSAMPLPPSFVAPSDRPAKVYATREQALARFRLMPEQPSGDLTRGRRALDQGDRRTAGRGSSTRASSRGCTNSRPRTRCRTSRARWRSSRASSARSRSRRLAADFARRLGRPAPLVTMPGVHHHMMLEDPQGLAAILDWLPETRLRTSAAAPATRR